MCNAKNSSQRDNLSFDNVSLARARAIIFGAGQYYSEMPFIPVNAYVIAADGGYDHIITLGIEPHAVIGDMDSIADDVKKHTNIEVITLPKEKDDTDMMAAVRFAWDKGAREFEFYGAFGGRIDHSIANLQLAAKIAQSGGVAFLHGDHTIATVICDAVMTFPGGYVAPSRPISLFAQSSVCEHVSVEGLKYEVDDEEWTNTNPVGVSNEFLPDTPVTIAVGGGSLTVIYPSEAPTPTITPLDNRRTKNNSFAPLNTQQSSRLAESANNKKTYTAQHGRHAAHDA